jgi:phosphoglycolate phosphatase-like HAD superfamily hydrolase
MKLVLFDVDGTLILTGGAGMRAYYRAMNSVFGVRAHSGLIRPDGKTDPLIAKELLTCFGMADQWCETARDALFSSYLEYLEEEMSGAKASGTLRVLPGALSLLEALSAQPEFALGLVTGNLERGAHIKLENAGLRKYFQFGGYGSDSDDRTELTRIGIRRGAQFVVPAPVEAAFIVGDTPLDVAHGHAAGAFVIAVASAGYTLDELGAHEPDLLVPDLTSAGTILSFARGKSWDSSALF